MFIVLYRGNNMLNKKQTEAVFSKDRFVFLLAGAGTGKTTVIISKIKKLLADGILAENILVLSFTRKSVKDLQTKLATFENLTITTFHGFCYKVLKSQIDFEIPKENWLISKGYTLLDLTKINLYKRNNKTSKMVKTYNKLLRENNLYDYTDLEYLTLKKLKSDSHFKNEITSRFKYIFADEFQDTSLIQYMLLKELVTKTSKYFCVGDPNQSIYSFRGASSKVINSYVKDFNAKIYLLNINYRSSPLILKASNKLISNNKRSYKFNLIPFKKEKGSITYKCFSSIKSKNKYIIEEIRSLLKLKITQEEIAIIYRNHHFANQLKKELYKTYFDRINFLSIHQVKGLEFDCVFFIGLEEGKIPFIDADIEEERRLFYVGITRARKHLYLLTKNKNKISRFVSETR